MLVRPGFKPATSRSADRRSPNSANQAAVNIVLARIRVDTNGHNFLNTEIVHRVLCIINNRWSIFASIYSRAFNYVPNVRNKLLKQGHFWPFAPRQLVGVIFCLISSFQLTLADNYYFQENLEIFTYK